MGHATTAELEAALDDVRAAPNDHGAVELVVRRPDVGQREVLDVGHLSRTEGLVGDTWSERSSKRSDDGGPHPAMQLTLMNVRMTRALAGDDSRIPLAGDQLYVDLDLSDENLPPGTRLILGTAVIEITEEPHTGCAKFAERFGAEGLRFVNSPLGRRLHLRGVNARVVTEGSVRPGDAVVKERAPSVGLSG